MRSEGGEGPHRAVPRTGGVPATRCPPQPWKHTKHPRRCGLGTCPARARQSVGTAVRAWWSTAHSSSVSVVSSARMRSDARALLAVLMGRWMRCQGGRSASATGGGGPRPGGGQGRKPKTFSSPFQSFPRFPSSAAPAEERAVVEVAPTLHDFLACRVAVTEVRFAASGPSGSRAEGLPRPGLPPHRPSFCCKTRLCPFMDNDDGEAKSQVARRTSLTAISVNSLVFPRGSTKATPVLADMPPESIAERAVQLRGRLPAAAVIDAGELQTPESLVRIMLQTIVPVRCHVPACACLGA